jgi:nitrate reductase gamma subunit
MAPFTGRYVDKLVPWWATLVALIGYALFQAIQVGAGGVNVAAVVIATIGLDLFRQLHQISLTTSVFGVDPSARSRLNAVLIIAIFLGQVMGAPS